MIKRRKLIVLMLSFILILGLVACQKDQGQAEPGQETELVETQGVPEEEAKEDEKVEEKEGYYPVVIENYNYAGQRIEESFEEAPQRVLAVYQNSIETMLALGLEDHILLAAGLDHSVKPELEEAFSKVKYFEDGFAPDKETVLMEEPDMILSWYSYFGEKNLGDVDFWHERDIKTYMSSNSGVISERNLQNEYDDILNLGKIFNVEDKAQAIVDEIKTEIAKVQDHIKTDQGPGPRVMVLEKLGDEIRVYGKNTIAGDMVDKLGGELLEVEGGSIGEEDLVKLNPDIIYSVYMDRDEEDAAGQAIRVFTDMASIQNIDALKADKVYSIALGEMYCSGIRTLDGLLTFARGMYPDLYE